jgi:hypothetical protein
MVNQTYDKEWTIINLTSSTVFFTTFIKALADDKFRAQSFTQAATNHN